ncbi:hypothetical protein V0M98_33040 (plasmid) [Pseudomonas silesiensis]|uniref:hypothetical protein n=1 Tax=Pseudomonas silesiensis TaxID=1853130 RepID=UPI0030CC5C57
MNIFRRAKHKIEEFLGVYTQYEIIEPVQNTDFELTEIAGKRILTIKRAHHPVQGIIFPAADKGDIWKISAQSKLINDVEKMYEVGWVDVCPIRDAISAFGLKTTPSTMKALDQLHEIHCVNFNNLHPEVYESIPRYLTHIFTEGRIAIQAVVIESTCETVSEP